MVADARPNGRPSDEEIAQKAYDIWLSSGRPEGRDAEHWMAAEQMLIAERQQQRGGEGAADQGRQGQGQQRGGGAGGQQRRRQPGAQPQQAQQGM